MALSTQPYKGARDFYPEDMRLLKYMFSTIRRVCERYGYEEYEAPIIEPTELYLSKGNQEIIDEQTYSFTDRGDRQVTIRTEMTPTVSRMVAGRRQELAYPVRWYSLPVLMRYERPQKGRLREFYQLNVDMFGVAGVEADVEIITIADQIFREFGASSDMFETKVNSRKFVNYVLGEYLGFDEVQQTSMIRLIDRMKKLDSAAFTAQIDALCSPSQREAGAVDKLQALLTAQTLADLPAELQSHDTLQPIQQVIAQLQAAGITNASFDMTLMRGFDYYTDVVFEVFDTDPANNRSMCGGGRYDGLVGAFGVEPVPTVGYAMGDAVLAEFLRGHNLLPTLNSETDAFVVLAGDILPQAQPVIAELRQKGVNLAIGLGGRKIGDQLKTAAKKQITFAIILGETELREQQYTIKNLQTGAEEKHGLDRIVSIVKDHRRKPAANDRD